MVNSIRFYTNKSLLELILLALFLILNYNVYAEGVKVVNPAIPLQSQLNDNSTVYVFNSCYDLKGQVVVIPQGTVLKFEGGKLINGIIKNSSFYVEAPRVQIFENILFFTIEDAGLQQLDPVRVKVLKDNSFFNIETDCIAKKGEIVNSRSLYRLSNPSCTSNAGNGLRKVTFNRTDYTVSDKWNNYTYPTRQMVGIDTRSGKMLQSSIIDAQNELFYQICPLIYNNVTTLLNREVYAEWFGSKVNATENQSNSLNYGISVATNSKAFFTMSSGVYRIDSPLIATTNTKIQGVDSSPWNVCTNLSINTGKGIIAFDEKGCNNLLLEGLSFSPHSKVWSEKYTGVEIRTSIQGVIIKNISSYQPEIGIYMHAYSDLMSASIENYKQLSGVYGIKMQPLFETTFKSSYCNGNKVEIGTGGSELMKKNALYIKNCRGNAICYNAGEQYGNPSVYCDNSVISITGISWHEESVYLQAVNNSIVNIIGDVFAMGSYLADESSIINYSGQNDSFYGHSIINSNYHVNSYKDIRFAALDPRHKTFLEWNGNVAFEVNESDIFYVNGTPYFSKGDAVRLKTPYDKAKGMTIFMRVSSSGKPHLKSPKVLLSGKPMFSFNPSTTFPICCINSIDNNHNLGYLNKGESIWSFYIIGDKVFTMNAVEVGTIKNNSDELSLEWRSESETAFTVSEVLFVDGVISDIIQVRDYERYMINEPRPVVPQTGKERPRLSQAYAGHLFYDASIGHLIMWNGEEWKNTDGSVIK